MIEVVWDVRRLVVISPPPSAPGIPRSHRYARSRPLTLCEGGDSSLRSE